MAAAACSTPRQSSSSSSSSASEQPTITPSDTPLDEYRDALKRMGVVGKAADAFLKSNTSSSSSSSQVVVTASLVVPGAFADMLADELLMYAASVSMNDAEKGTQNETEVFSLAGERSFVCRPVLTGDMEDGKADAAAALWPRVRLNITIDAATLAAEVPGVSSRDAVSQILHSAWMIASGGSEEALPEFELHSESTPLNWIKHVEASYKPVRIFASDDNVASSSSLSAAESPSIWVVPMWKRDQVSNDDDDESAHRVLLLEPGLAFGTGAHPTTKLCLQWLLRSSSAAVPKINNVLDIGTGSGILGCASALLFGRSATVYAIDVDPLAVIASRRNAAYNSVSNRMHVYECGEDGTAVPDSDVDSIDIDTDTVRTVNSLMVSGEFDVVLANILQPTLLALEPVIARATRRGGSICLSGILRKEQADAIVVAYSEHFDDVHVIGDDSEWCIVTGTRNSAFAAM